MPQGTAPCQLIRDPHRLLVAAAHRGVRSQARPGFLDYLSTHSAPYFPSRIGPRSRRTARSRAGPEGTWPEGT